MLSVLLDFVPRLLVWALFLGDDDNCGEPIGDSIDDDTLLGSELLFGSESDPKLLLVGTMKELKRLDEKFGRPQLQQIHDALLSAKASKTADGICRQFL